MALDFPDSPAVGDLYGSSGVVWRWDGARWASTSGVSGARGSVGFARATVTQSGMAQGTTTDLAGLVVTFNAQAGRRYKIIGDCYGQTDTATPGQASLLIMEGGTLVNSSNKEFSVGNYPFKMHIEAVVDAPTTVIRTVRLAYAAQLGGTHRAFAAVDAPMFILVEDITYEAGSSAPGGGGGPAAPAVTAGAGLVLTDNVMAVVAADGNLLVTEDAVQLNPNLSIVGLGASGTVQGAYVHSNGNVNAAGTVTGAAASIGGTIYASGDITTAASMNMVNGYAGGQIQMNTGRVNGVGHMYPGCTIGGGNANFMGLTWIGNEVLGTIDNVVAASLGVGSDRRIKREIAEFKSGLDVVLALNPVTYKVRDFHVHDDGPITFTDAEDDTVQVGLVADEVAWVAPWAVIGEANDPGQIQSVTYTKLVAPLIQAVQDQQAQIAALTARLEALEAGA